MLRIVESHPVRYDFKKKETDFDIELQPLICTDFSDDEDVVLENFLADSLEEVYKFTEKMPQYPGGTVAMTSFIEHSLQYPEIASRNGIKGTVLLEFIVEKDGSISHVHVKIPLFPECDMEAVRIIKSMPKWNPAIIQGEPVRCYYQVPVTFRL